MHQSHKSLNESFKHKNLNKGTQQREHECYLPLISATVMQRRKKNEQNFTFHLIHSHSVQHWISTVPLIISPALHDGSQSMKLPLWIQMRVLFYCVLWYNKSFIAAGRLIFITLYLVLPPSEWVKQRDKKERDMSGWDWPCSAAALSVASEWVDPEGFLMKRRRRLKSSSQ